MLGGVKALLLVVLLLSLSACSHVECAIDTDCPTLGTYCALDTHACVPLAGGDAGPRDAAVTDGAPRDGATEAGPTDASAVDAAADTGAADAGVDAAAPADADTSG